MRMVQMTSVTVLWLILVCCIESVNGQVATFKPNNPKLGDVISVTYMPWAKHASIRKASEVTLQVLVLPEIGKQPLLVETPLQKSDSVWKGTVKLEATGARYLLYQFVSGNLRDDNAEEGWGTLVVGANGKALEGGHYWRGAVLAFGGYKGFKLTKDIVAAKAEFVQERKLYNENYHALSLSWYLETNPIPTEEGIAHVRKELNAVFPHFRKNEEALPTFLVWLELTGQTPKADSLRQVMTAENPKGKVAMSWRQREISKERDLMKRWQDMEEYIADFPMKEDELLAYQKQLVIAYVQAEQYDKAYLLLKHTLKLDPDLYRTATAPMVDKGFDLKLALRWLVEGIDRARKQDESFRPPSSTKAEWKKSQASTLAALLNTYGEALTKLKRKIEAEPAFMEAYELTNGDDLAIDVNLLDACIANEKSKEAEGIGLDCLGKGKSNLPIVEKVRTAYMKMHGSLSGYDEAVQNAKLAEESRLLKRGINKPAPDFFLRDMNGGTVKLSDLRGKVVVLNFWAMWCGQCKASLPHLQKVVERYRDYRTVAFVGINAFESVTGPARDSLVKKFMNDGKYTFPLVYDEGSSYAQQLAVEGIPAVVVIDRQGNIQFKTVGFSNGDEMVNELVTQIDLLLKH